MAEHSARDNGRTREARDHPCVPSARSNGIAEIPNVCNILPFTRPFVFTSTLLFYYLHANSMLWLFVLLLLYLFWDPPERASTWELQFF